MKLSELKSKLRKIDPEHKILKGAIKILLFVLGLITMALGITRCRGEWIIISLVFEAIQLVLSNVRGW